MFEELGLNKASTYCHPQSLQDDDRSRTWFSLYIFSTLLSLQLGLPTPIKRLPYQRGLLPRNDDDHAFGLGADGEGYDESSNEDATSHMEYFLRMIRFCNIASRVTSFESPTDKASMHRMSIVNESLEHDLMEWEDDIPWNLSPRGRFGPPATEQSLMTIRQRRMLGLSRFHLMSLAYRPFVGSDVTSADDQESCSGISEMHAKDMMSMFEEPRRSGRHILDEFPWWQMTPYLIYASSLFFVLEIHPRYLGTNHFEGKYRLRPEDARGNAEGCLKLLESLQVGSAEAQRAARLLRGLSARHSRTGPIGPASSSRRVSVDVGASAEWSPEFSSAMAWLMHFYTQSSIPTRLTVPAGSNIQAA
ncbi:hypothetical protein BP00DRAFT_6545 [Aspergillus indologenus CBS 114.80]|uniref:Xylanolytic transcriptional activator regulatory domain-containing protein n=1 Tax=Aspergillus indologenus CBS 114.80 TaxID=1450541 RepID=A0A2V5J3X1_9EURO|nr:hypothetical protein BP00DRAFT_6545 [Aspergillus indologenus CBS 114.80]